MSSILLSTFLNCYGQEVIEELTIDFEAGDNYQFIPIYENDIDNPGTFGVRNGAFEINDMEGTQCGPPFSITNGFNDNLAILLSGAASMGYCNVSVQIITSISNAQFEPCLSPNQLNPFGCTDFLGTGPGGDGMLIEVRKSDAVILTAGYCGANQEGTFAINNLDVSPGELLQVFITGGTQATDESYFINEIRVTGFPRSFVGAQIVASNTDLCAGMEPLILREVTEGSNYRWEKDGVLLPISSEMITIPLVSLEDMGTYTVTFTEAGGCEASGSIDISVQDCTPDIPDFSFEPTYCESDTLMLSDRSPNGVNGRWNESSPLVLLDRVGLVDLQFTDSQGTVYDYDFQVLPSFKSDINRKLCSGETFIFNGNIYDPIVNTSGIEIITDPGICDSIFFIDIELLKDTIVDVLGLICGNETIRINDIEYSSSFFQNNDTLTAANGCDSILQINLTFLPIHRDTIRGDRMYCPDDVVRINGVNYDINQQMGIDTFLSKDNCDSIEVIDLIFIVQDTIDLTITLCPDETRVVAGVTIDESSPSGEYFSGPNDCDSLIRYDVTVYPEIRTDLIINLCPNQDTIINGQLLDAGSNSFGEFILVASSGCDSTVSISINAISDTVVSIIDTICYDDFIVVGTERFDRANPMGQVNYISANGCDSTIMVELSFYPDYMTLVDPVLCSGEFIRINGIVYDESNRMGSEVLRSSTGCDSLVSISLTFSPNIVVDINGPLCTGETIIVDGVIYNQDTPIGSAILSGGPECDTLVNIDLTFIPTYDTLIQLDLCAGDSIIVNGTLYNRMNPIGSESMRSTLGCDSVVRLDLTFSNPVETFVVEMLCPTESITVNDQIYDKNQTEGIETMISNSGCDSVIYVDLTFLEAAFSDLRLSLCTGDSIIVNGIRYDESRATGIEMIPEGAANGCDSTINITLTFSNEIRTELDTSICTGSMVEIDGEIFDVNRPTGEILYTSMSNCDSIVTVSIDFVDEPSISISGGELSCAIVEVLIELTTDGAQFEWSGPNGYRSTQQSPSVSEVGTYIVTVQNTIGCISIDSIVINGDYTLPIFSIDTPDTLRCTNSGVVINFNSVSAVPNWTGPNGFVQAGNSIVVFDPGAYTASVIGNNGCIDSASTEVVLIDPTFTLGSIVNTCDGIPNGSIEVRSVEGLSFPLTIIGFNRDTTIQNLPIVFDNLGPGDFMVMIEGSDGCIAQDFVTLSDDRSNSLSISSELINTTGDFALNLNYNALIDQVIWADIPGLSCYDCIDPIATINISTTYLVTVIDVDGCTSTASIDLFYAPSTKIYIPNVINIDSPNGNDRFYPQGNFGRTTTYDLSIFDRWGSEIHIEFNSLVNDPNSGWAGVYSGAIVSAGVYVYVLTVYEDDGSKELMTGSISLVKD